MIRVGYPANLTFAIPDDLPPDIELVALDDPPQGEIELDVWISDPYPSRSQLKWPHLRGVKLLLSLLAGTEWAPPLVGPDVTIVNARGAHTIATAEWTLGAVLAMLKYVPLYLDIQQSGIWKRRFEASEQYKRINDDQRAIAPPVLQEELRGKRVLLVGYGDIGKEIERLLAPFNVDLVRVAKSARTEPLVHAVDELDSLLPTAEIVILILPASAETRNMIGSRQLDLMKHGTLLVNAARGSIIDTDALVLALNAGRIRAALDVTEPEPLPAGHPLWSCPNLLLTPHVAGSSPQFAARSLRVAFDELRRYMKGEPMLNVVQFAAADPASPSTQTS